MSGRYYQIANCPSIRRCGHRRRVRAGRGCRCRGDGHGRNPPLCSSLGIGQSVAFWQIRFAQGTSTKPGQRLAYHKALLKDRTVPCGRYASPCPLPRRLSALCNRPRLSYGDLVGSISTWLFLVIVPKKVIVQEHQKDVPKIVAIHLYHSLSMGKAYKKRSPSAMKRKGKIWRFPCSFWA